MTEQLILENISKRIQDKKVTGSSQHWFTKGKSCLTNLMAFYSDMTIYKGRAVDDIYLDFSKGFDIVSYNIFLDTLTKCGLVQWVVRQKEYWLNPSAAENPAEGKSVVVYARGQYWGQYYLIS